METGVLGYAMVASSGLTLAALTAVLRLLHVLRWGVRQTSGGDVRPSKTAPVVHLRVRHDGAVYRGRSVR